MNFAKNVRTAAPATFASIRDTTVKSNTLAPYQCQHIPSAEGPVANNIQSQLHTYS